ncbi:Maf family protein [Bordetella genomosp. 11]|uniref:dTTP/UTP pyrophosphatase n=1 Tax=Bordetella genomosp. 11 TaxID=1416808 RepID=A0A261UHG8_9BORD|nr:Maf family protein [Bordetella genomosp. 11]OZI61364.1 septum formation inhibitor Maf [Bordetella genomosp. 11]
MPSDRDPAPRLYLASASPRRRELLMQIGLAHRVLDVPSPPGEDEPQHAGEPAADYVRRTAREKAVRGEQYRQDMNLPRLPLLAADTTVILDGEVLGKPADRDHAIHMLMRLSGSRHEVHTAVALFAHDRLHEKVSITQVWMRPLDSDEVRRYCDSGEPYGKAGAYGIQGLAAAFIERIDGSYTGVMGLPLFETAALLQRVDIALP